MLVFPTWFGQLDHFSRLTDVLKFIENLVYSFNMAVKSTFLGALLVLDNLKEVALLMQVECHIFVCKGGYPLVGRKDLWQ